jgi:hypothetical protein
MTPDLLSSIAQGQATDDSVRPSLAEIKFIEPIQRLSTVFMKTSALHQHRCRQDRRDTGHRLRATGTRLDTATDRCDVARFRAAALSRSG